MTVRIHVLSVLFVRHGYTSPVLFLKYLSTYISFPSLDFKSIILDRPFISEDEVKSEHLAR